MYSPQDCEIRNPRDFGIRLVTAGDTRRGSARVSERTDQVHVGRVCSVMQQTAWPRCRLIENGFLLRKR